MHIQLQSEWSHRDTDKQWPKYTVATMSGFVPRGCYPRTITLETLSMQTDSKISQTRKTKIMLSGCLAKMLIYWRIGFCSSFLS